jgi:3-hydroxy-9,10-secoandrosta-1,3,5(10)-triene-9,17-dione monooxygenase reductase component
MIAAMSDAPDPKLTIGKALGRVPSGLFVLTCVDSDKRVAVLVSWAQQAAFNPPSMSVAVTKERAGRETIERTKKFALAVIPETDLSLMKKYARGTKPGVDPLDGLELLHTPTGLPIPASALAWLECSLVSVCDFGADHDLLLATVTDGAVLREGDAYAHQRNNGLRY